MPEWEAFYFRKFFLNGKGSLSLSFIRPSCACYYSAYSLILQLIQFLDNPLSHQIQNTVKLTFLQSHTTTTTALLTQVSIRILAKTSPAGKDTLCLSRYHSLTSC